MNVYNGQSFKASCLRGHGECLVFQITRACCTGRWGAISCALLASPPRRVMWSEQLDRSGRGWKSSGIWSLLRKVARGGRPSGLPKDKFQRWEGREGHTLQEGSRGSGCYFCSSYGFVKHTCPHFHEVVSELKHTPTPRAPVRCWDQSREWCRVTVSTPWRPSNPGWSEAGGHICYLGEETEENPGKVVSIALWGRRWIHGPSRAVAIGEKVRSSDPIPITGGVFEGPTWV